MQYFSKLPKTEFQSTIGTFRISDFFTYIDPTNLPQQSYTKEYDNSNTLVEAAATTYNSPDSFWIFCLLSDNYNPFTLNKQNSAKEKDAQTPKLNIATTFTDKGTSFYIPPKGSIVVPYVANSGSSASFSSVGNFNLNGGFAVVDNDYYFSRSSVLKELQVNTSFIKEGFTGSQYVVISKSSTGGYVLNTVYLDSVQKALEKVAYTYDSATSKLTSQYKTYNPKVGVSQPVNSVSKTPTKYSGITTVDSVTYETVLKTQINTLPAYPVNYIGEFTNYYVTTKYY
jgi:hypothetical protein